MWRYCVLGAVVRELSFPHSPHTQHPTPMLYVTATCTCLLWEAVHLESEQSMEACVSEGAMSTTLWLLGMVKIATSFTTSGNELCCVDAIYSINIILCIYIVLYIVGNVVCSE